MNKSIIILTSLFVASLASSSPDPAGTHAKPAQLRVSDNHRFLVTADGKPFFYLGDTAWELFHRLNREDYNRQPVKPVLDGESLYEDHPVSFKAKNFGHSIASDVRRPLYWNLFTGVFGHTYGHHSVWQMWAPPRTPVNNPRNGEAKGIGEFSNIGTREFTPPDRGEMMDWVLVLDEAAKGFLPPGTHK